VLVSAGQTIRGHFLADRVEAVSLVDIASVKRLLGYPVSRYALGMALGRRSLLKPGAWLAGSALVGALAVGIAFASVSSKSGINLLWMLLWVCAGVAVLGMILVLIARARTASTPGVCSYPLCERQAPPEYSPEFDLWYGFYDYTDWLHRHTGWLPGSIDLFPRKKLLCPDHIRADKRAS
jgi:hypothetical protein